MNFSRGCRSLNRFGYSRSGMSVLVVMTLVSITLALSYAIMRSQMVNMQLQANSSRAGLARQAALAGLTTAMRNMRLNSWTGVSTTLAGSISATDSYSVTYTSGDAELTSASPEYGEYPWRVTLLSTGTSIDPAHPSVSSTYRIGAVMKVIPRAVNPNPSNWPTLLSYTLYQLSNGKVDMPVPSRVEGPVRLQGALDLASWYNWGSSKRNRYLSDLNAMISGMNEVQQIGFVGVIGGSFTVSFNGATTSNIAWNASAATLQTALQNLSTIGYGNVTVTGSAGNWSVAYKGTLAAQNVLPMTLNPANLFGLGLTASCNTTTPGVAGTADHRPLSGPLYLPTSQTDSENMGLLTSQLALTVNNIFASTTTAPPATSAATYRLYKGGPQYTAAQLPASVSNVILTADPVTNPLAIFYCAGSATLGNNVTITGTVVTDGDLQVNGVNVHMSSYDLPAVEGSTAPVRLPAVIAGGDFRVSGGANVTVNGTMCVRDDLRVDDGAESTRMAITGNVVLTDELRIGTRTEWSAYSSAQWDLFYTVFQGQLSLSSGIPFFPQYLAVVQGRSYVPLLTIKPDSSNALRQWPDFSNPLYIPASGDSGMHWDLVSISENL